MGWGNGVEMPKNSPRVYSFSSGISAICSGTTSRPTTATNRIWRPLNSIHENA